MKSLFSRERCCLDSLHSSIALRVKNLIHHLSLKIAKSSHNKVPQAAVGKAIYDSVHLVTTCICFSPILQPIYLIPCLLCCSIVWSRNVVGKQEVHFVNIFGKNFGKMNSRFENLHCTTCMHLYSVHNYRRLYSSIHHVSSLHKDNTVYCCLFKEG